MNHETLKEFQRFLITLTGYYIPDEVAGKLLSRLSYDAKHEVGMISQLTPLELEEYLKNCKSNTKFA